MPDDIRIETDQRSATGGTPPPSRPPLLTSATRHIDKATLVPLNVEVPQSGQVLAKSGFVGQLGLRSGEVDAVRALLGTADDAVAAAAVPSTVGEGQRDAMLTLLGSCEDRAQNRPWADDFAEVPVSGLLAFGHALVAVRREQVEAASPAELEDARTSLAAAMAATQGFAIVTAETPLGMLNLERLEMTPAGMERGELVATVPLAPLEETAVVHKEWSVQTKEFTSIVTDSLEEFSETGVTDNTELAQSTSSQTQHSNQFNVTGTVSGGIPVISGSASSGFTSQGSESTSANDSRKHAKTLTEKASSRSKQEHKVTISTTTVTGTEMSTTRKVRNPSATEPMRIDYFSMMRKWQVRLYRYGLRLTYDIVIPEPGAAMRATYKQLSELRERLGPFDFPVTHDEITEAVRPGETQPHYLVLADRYDAQGLSLPPASLEPQTFRVESGGGEGRTSATIKLTVPNGYEIVDVTLAGRMTSYSGHLGQFTVEGTSVDFEEKFGNKAFPPGFVLQRDTGGAFLQGATGSPTVVLTFDWVSTQTLQLTARLRPLGRTYQQWQIDVWTALFNAAQTTYFAEQQDIAARVAALEERLNKVDTLTLRREESDEIMKGVIRFIAGQSYRYMSAGAETAFDKAALDSNGASRAEYGIGFVANELKIADTDMAAVRQHEQIVRMINQAIEWENVVSFLYSYFWDTPKSWDFIRDIQHPDATRQAFLRAGAARVVLTVRKGWEETWLRFAESGFTNPKFDPDVRYLKIAQEIAAYDDRNYPGLPPANPARTATRLQDSVYAASAAVLRASESPVTIKVDTTSGFVVGEPVVIDSADKRNAEKAVIQESQLVTSILDSNRLVVAKLKYDHDGSAIPFAVVQPGAKGALIAEWNEYTPTSGTDIEVGSDLGTIA
ncbi:hypothetical protein ACQPW1_28545 [Nocardia sp. CA-128927]|uniref:hypothetical protein n=1 Tax=Nocardia sp. CA-128927 TaxID=3239975 RepID=UPI003D97830E